MCGRELIRGLLHRLPEIGCMAFDRELSAKTAAREVEEVAHHVMHPFADAYDSFGQLEHLWLLVWLLEHQLRRHDDRRDWISKIVTEDAEEHFSRPVDALDELGHRRRERQVDRLVESDEIIDVVGRHGRARTQPEP